MWPVQLHLWLPAVGRGRQSHSVRAHDVPHLCLSTSHSVRLCHSGPMQAARRDKQGWQTHSRDHLWRRLAREGEGEVQLRGVLLLEDDRARVASAGMLPGDQHADQHGDGLRAAPQISTRHSRLCVLVSRADLLQSLARETEHVVEPSAVLLLQVTRLRLHEQVWCPMTITRHIITIKLPVGSTSQGGRDVLGANLLQHW